MSKKLVVLDGHTLNPGDLDWEPLKNLVDEFEIYDRSDVEEIVEPLVQPYNGIKKMRAAHTRTAALRNLSGRAARLAAKNRCSYGILVHACQ